MSIHELNDSAPKTTNFDEVSGVTVFAEVYMGSNPDGTLGLKAGDVVVLSADGTWRKI